MPRRFLLNRKLPVTCLSLLWLTRPQVGKKPRNWENYEIGLTNHGLTEKRRVSESPGQM